MRRLSFTRTEYFSIARSFEWFFRGFDSTTFARVWTNCRAELFSALSWLRIPSRIKSSHSLNAVAGRGRVLFVRTRTILANSVAAAFFFTAAEAKSWLEKHLTLAILLFDDFFLCRRRRDTFLLDNFFPNSTGLLMNLFRIGATVTAVTVEYIHVCERVNSAFNKSNSHWYAIKRTSEQDLPFACSPQRRMWGNYKDWCVNVCDERSVSLPV